jgi:pimeloyl-ACP methyl ester carboxylesterase
MSTDATSDWIDPSAIRALAEADVDRASDMGATLLNHARMRFTGPRGGSFEAVGVPTLVLHGERDALFPVAHGRAVADATPDAELVVLSGAGHTLQSANADQLIAALRRHLDAAA